MRSQTAWPKELPPLSEEQRRISNDFMRYWHEVLPRKYSSIERFNHGYPIRAAQSGFVRTLEIGAGLGEHLEYEELSVEQRSNYYTLELRENMSRRIKDRFPFVN